MNDKKFKVFVGLYYFVPFSGIEPKRINDYEFEVFDFNEEIAIDNCIRDNEFDCLPKNHYYGASIQLMRKEYER